MAQNVEDVTFNVTANTGQAEQALAKLRGEVDRTSASLGRKGDAAKKASSFSGCMYAVGSGSVNFFRYSFRLVPHWDV